LKERSVKKHAFLLIITLNYPQKWILYYVYNVKLVVV